MIKEKCFHYVLVLFLITTALLAFTHYQVNKSRKLIDEIEFVDSLNHYNKIYYENSFKKLKKENEQLYDSLKVYKDKISYLIEFTHKKTYKVDTVFINKEYRDTIFTDKPLVSNTFEYKGEPNDTFQYKLLINSHTEPNWYSLETSVKNKFTIVNKEDGNGMNQITIGSGNGGDISDVTVFKKKRSNWNRISVGPAVTAGYDPLNNKFGVMVGVAASYNLLKN